MQLIYEQSIPGRRGIKLPASDVPAAAALPAALLRTERAGLAEVSELDLVRHFTNLSRRNFSVDTNFYPLGSCTMKYNAKVLENAAALFAPFHPMTALLPGGVDLCQGTLGMLYDLGQLLAEITGMDEVTTQPLAGAHGEMTGIMLIAAYHAARGNKAKKKYVVVPDSSHGTNPASAAIAGYEIITVPTAPYGDMDLELFKKAMTDEVAAVMMTCPNTLGLFNPHIKEISDIAHGHDALMYYDGANLNAIMGKVKPGDVGFDVVHVNLHKTFGTPHGGGGPGSGPVGVKKALIPFLPQPRIVKDDGGTLLLETANPGTIGRTANFFGNFGVMARAYAYIIMLGREGLIQVSEQAVLNANYIKERLKALLRPPLRHDLHARVRLFRIKTAGAWRPCHRHRQIPDRQGVSSPDGLFPDDRQGGDHDRADRDREQGSHGRLHRGDDRSGPDRREQPAGAARRAADHADLAAGRDQGGPGAERLLYRVSLF